MNPLLQLIEAEKPVLLDGAMGTMLMNAGLDQGTPPEAWNLLHPERVRQVHRGYIQAGSRLILTNSFGGNRFRLEMHGWEGRIEAVNQAAAENARAEADAVPHTVAVAGSIGPTGKMLEPLGPISFQQAKDAYTEQAAALAAGGVDAFWIETMSDLKEVQAAIEGVRSTSDLPIVATMSFDTNGHTMMGVSPSQAIAALKEFDLIAIGANCGTGSDELQEAIQEMQEDHPNVALVAKANAGIPKTDQHGEIFYNGTPEVMADYAANVREIGATLIGGCCGNTPEHIQAMARALELPVPDDEA